MRGTTTLLGKGSRCAPPLHPPGLWPFLGIEPTPEPRTYPRSISRRRLRSPLQSIDQRAIAPLETTRNLWPLHHQSGERSCYPQYPHDHFMETISSRPGRAFHSCPCLGTIPSTKGPSSPIGTLTNPARIGCRQRIGAELDQEAYRRPLNPPRSGRLVICFQSGKTEAPADEP